MPTRHLAPEFYQTSDAAPVVPIQKRVQRHADRSHDVILPEWIGRSEFKTTAKPALAVDHPRYLPADDPRHIAWEQSLATPRKRLPNGQVARPTKQCRLCEVLFSPSVGNQLDCRQCRSLIQSKLRHAGARLLAAGGRAQLRQAIRCRPATMTVQAAIETILRGAP